MADLPQYTGVTYDAEMYKKPEETMSDYMLRLAKLRASGVLGGGGMLDTAKPAQVVDTNTTAPLGQVVVNRPRESGLPGADPDQRTTEEKYRDMVEYMANRDPNTYPAWAPGGAAIGLLDGLSRGFLTPYAMSNYEERYPEMTQRVKEEYLMSLPVEAVKQESKQGFLESIFGNPAAAISPVTDFLLGKNDAATAANIPVVTSYPSWTRATAISSPAIPMTTGMLTGPTVTPDMPNYIVDTGSGLTTSGSYNDSGDWSWSGTDFSAPSTTSDGNDWSSW